MGYPPISLRNPCLRRAEPWVFLSGRKEGTGLCGVSPFCQRSESGCLHTCSPGMAPRTAENTVSGAGTEWEGTEAGACPRWQVSMYILIEDHENELQKRFQKFLLKIAPNLKKQDLPGRQGEEPVN